MPISISVIITSFRKAHFLREAVESVVQQTCTSWECFIVNDGSPDNTSEIARALIAEHPGRKITLVEKENEGVAEARNTAIRQACGEWIVALDGDDALMPDYFERCLQAAQTNPSINLIVPDLICFGASEEYRPFTQFDRECLLLGNLFPYCSMYKRALWQHAGGYPQFIPFGAEDWSLWIRCADILATSHLKNPLVRYRTHDSHESLTSKLAAHMGEVNASVRTAHPRLYSAHQLLLDHELLASMAEETRAEIEKIIDKFPLVSFPYLWRGLHNQKTGRPQQAIRDFEVAARLSVADDWQPLFCLTVAHLEQKETERAAYYARRTLAQTSNFPLTKLLEEIISRGGGRAEQRGLAKPC